MIPGGTGEGFVYPLQVHENPPCAPRPTIYKLRQFFLFPVFCLERFLSTWKLERVVGVCPGLPQKFFMCLLDPLIFHSIALSGVKN